MRKPFNKFVLAVILVGLSVFFYWLSSTLFANDQEEFFLFFQDLAFLPLSVLLVTLILDGIIKEREKRERLTEINIVVGAFFSELGSDAIRRIKPFITNMEGILGKLEIDGSYGFKDFKSSVEAVMRYEFKADSSLGDLPALGVFLYEKKSIILALFENPNLLENSRFTSMLWALYHLMDEIKNRDDFSALPGSDMAHLSGDLQRAYRFLVLEWLFYMEHMKTKYPYLFSLAVRKNPFLEEKSVVIY